jgi:uncharacterized membrane protein YbhN (UPF0104 family)
MAAARNPPWHSWAFHRLTLLVIVAASLAAGALIGLTWVVGVRKVLTGLVHPHWLWLGVAVVGEVVAYIGYTAAYREVARAEDGAELEVPKAAALVATGFGVFVHGGGFALDRAALERAGLPREEARRRVLGLGTLEYAVLAPATLVAAVLVLLWHPTISSSLTVPWIVGVPVGTVLTLIALRYEEAVGRWPVIGKPLGQGLHAIRLVLGLLRAPRRHGLAFAGTFAYWAGDMFCLWSTLHAFSAHTPPVAQLIVGYSTGYAITRRALPLGGAGVVEALLPFALGWLDIRLAPALLAVFAYRLINLWLPIIPALAGLPTLRRLERRTPRRRSSRRRALAPAGTRRGGRGS